MSAGSAFPGFETLVDQAVDDLSGRLEVGAAEIEVVSAESVTWPDRGLGCPSPGMVYLQVLVDGARVVLAAGGRRYAYHSGGGRGPFLCEKPARPN